MNAIELAAFASWPAVEEEDFLGWRLRFANGYTKRANSANSTPTSAELTVTDVTTIEERFSSRGLSPIFRLTSLSAPPRVDDLLASRHYRFTELSLVMSKPLASEDGKPPLLLDDAKEWLELYQHISGVSESDKANQWRLLQGIDGQCAFTVHFVDGQPAACGLAVLTGEHLGLFDIVTSPRYRGQGMAQALCSGLLGWGKKCGARTAFVQVSAANAIAVRVYEKVGYRTAYQYWYRVLA